MTAGIDAPDRRGRTGLDQHGRDLTGNPRVRIREVELLSSDWYVLRKTTFDYQHSVGHWKCGADYGSWAWLYSRADVDHG